MQFNKQNKHENDTNKTLIRLKEPLHQLEVQHFNGKVVFMDKSIPILIKSAVMFDSNLHLKMLSDQRCEGGWTD